jgi:hypothetical protein
VGIPSVAHLPEGIDPAPAMAGGILLKSNPEATVMPPFRIKFLLDIGSFIFIFYPNNEKKPLRILHKTDILHVEIDN